MAPNEAATIAYEVLDKKSHDYGHETLDENTIKVQKLTTDLNYKHKIIPFNIVAFIILHAAGLYGFYMIITLRPKLISLIYGILLGVVSGEGILLGAHRSFAHNSFKLNTFGQVIFIILHSITAQYTLHWWIRDHRLHHKFCDTDADPYNAKRGFFFSHIGWLMMHKHPLVFEKGRTIDMSDIESNKLIMFQKRHYILMIVGTNLIATLIPVYLWNEDLAVSFFGGFAFRMMLSLNATWSINSVAHLYGAKPFDTRITARHSRLAHILTMGEGWHNYHHVFPWDHAISEFGYGGGVSTAILHLLCRLGIAYDLKKPSEALVYKHYKKYGDATLTDEDFNFKRKELETKKAHD